MLSKIIQILRANPNGYISGEEISRTLKISRAGIWKYIQELRSDGYEIAAVPHLGYQLVSAPDKLLPQEIQSGLQTKFVGKHLVYEEDMTSTMDVAFRLGMEGEPEGTVVCAEGQSKGRGRMGRHWLSPKGKGIYMSVILRPRCSASEAARLTLLGAVAVAEAIAKVSQLKPVIKWPNDVLVNNKKIVGILTELRAEIDQVKFVVIGIGINVNATASQLIPEATSMKIEGHQNFSRVAVMQAVLKSLEEWYAHLQRQGFAPVRERWKDLASTIKQRVKIHDGRRVVEGEAVDIDHDGGLMIRLDSGVVVKKMAGDVAVAR